MSHEISMFRNMLRVNRHRLDDELEVQAEVMDRIAQNLTTMRSREIEMADELKRCEARIFADSKDGGATEKASEAASKRHPERVRAWQKWQAARSECDEWKELYEAWKVKGFTLRDLGALYAAEYFTVDTLYRGDKAHTENTTKTQELLRAASANIKPTEPTNTRRRVVG